MKKFKTLLVGALLAFAGNAMGQTVTFSAEDVTIEAGETADLVVSLENSMDIVAWSFKLYLPEGVKVAYSDEEEDYVIELSDRHTKKHLPDVTPTTDGGYLIKAYAATAKAINEHSGELVTVTLEAESTFAADGTATIKEGAVSTADAVQYNASENVTFNVKKAAPTGINGVSINAEDGAVYNMQGQRVENAQNGIFIQNGKKVVVK